MGKWQDAKKLSDFPLRNHLGYFSSSPDGLLYPCSPQHVALAKDGHVAKPRVCVEGTTQGNWKVCTPGMLRQKSTKNGMPLIPEEVLSSHLTCTSFQGTLQGIR